MDNLVMYQGFFLRCCCILLAGVCGLPLGAHARDNIRIGWVYAMANAPAIVAEHYDMYRRQGVDVELRQFNSGPLVMRALQAGDLDMAYIGMPPVYHAYADGLRLRIVAKVNYGQAALITQQDSEIKTLADLGSKRIASVRKGSGMDILLRGFVLKDAAGLDPQRDVKLVTMPAKIMQAAVQRGLVDAAFTWEPYVSQAVISGHARVVLDVNKELPRYPWYVLVATESIANTKRDAMLRVLKAHEQAVYFLNEDQDAGADLLIEKFNLGIALSAMGSNALPIEVVRQARTRIGWECQFRNSDREFLQRLINYSLELGHIKRPLDASELLDVDAINSLERH